MKRWSVDHRRRGRRRLSSWIWFLLCSISIVGLVLSMIQPRNHQQDPSQIVEKDTRTENVSPSRLNFTEEVTSASSYSRQLAQQMTLAKAYVFIAKEHNNLHLAWELSSKIRSCQFLLSKAAKRGQPISLDEAKLIISGLSALIYKAQDAHYDIATTMMTMKSHIQALEERANAATVQLYNCRYISLGMILEVRQQE